MHDGISRRDRENRESEMRLAVEIGRVGSAGVRGIAVEIGRVRRDGRGDRENREMSREELDRLIEQVRQVAYRLHVYLGVGLLEKVYENGLKHRLEKAGFKVDAQKPLKVVDEDGFVLGDYYADLVVNDELIIELKAVKMIANEHLAQLLNYLAITKQAAGLLINFGSYRFESRVVHAKT